MCSDVTGSAEQQDEDAPMVRERDRDGNFVREDDGRIRKTPSRAKPKTEMCFARLPSKDKKKVELLATQWSALLKSDATNTKVYAITDDKVLFVIEDGYEA